MKLHFKNYIVPVIVTITGVLSCPKSPLCNIYCTKLKLSKA